MSANVSPVPEGFNTVSAHIIIKNAKEALEFYKKAFGAEELCVMTGPDGNSVMHAEIKIGNSVIMIGDEYPGPGVKSPVTLNGSSVCIHIYTEDADALFDRAKDAGATEVMPIGDQFWGDRYGMLSDPYGHYWSVATHKEDLTVDEINKRAEEFFKNMGDCGCDCSC